MSGRNQYRSRLARVRVDSIGVGYNFRAPSARLRLHGRVGKCRDAVREQTPIGREDPARRFLNLRACFYQELADAFERDQVEGLLDETTIGQLAGLLYEFDSQGRMKIESKEKARERGVVSPDRADALMLALCKAPYESLADSLV